MRLDEKCRRIYDYIIIIIISNTITNDTNILQLDFKAFDFVRRLNRL